MSEKQVFMTLMCPSCKKLQPHSTVGTKKNPKGGKIQTMECCKCKTCTTVYFDNEGRQFQENLDYEPNQ